MATKENIPSPPHKDVVREIARRFKYLIEPDRSYHFLGLLSYDKVMHELIDEYYKQWFVKRIDATSREWLLKAVKYLINSLSNTEFRKTNLDAEHFDDFREGAFLFKIIYLKLLQNIGIFASIVSYNAEQEEKIESMNEVLFTLFPQNVENMIRSGAVTMGVVAGLAMQVKLYYTDVAFTEYLRHKWYQLVNMHNNMVKNCGQCKQWLYVNDKSLIELYKIHEMANYGDHIPAYLTTSLINGVIRYITINPNAFDLKIAIEMIANFAASWIVDEMNQKLAAQFEKFLLWLVGDYRLDGNSNRVFNVTYSILLGIQSACQSTHHKRFPTMLLKGLIKLINQCLVLLITYAGVLTKNQKNEVLETITYFTSDIKHNYVNMNQLDRPFRNLIDNANKLIKEFEAPTTMDVPEHVEAVHKMIKYYQKKEYTTKRRTSIACCQNNAASFICCLKEFQWKPQEPQDAGQVQFPVDKVVRLIKYYHQSGLTMDKNMTRSHVVDKIVLQCKNVNTNEYVQIYEALQLLMPQQKKMRRKDKKNKRMEDGI